MWRITRIDSRLCEPWMKTGAILHRVQYSIDTYDTRAEPEVEVLEVKDQPFPRDYCSATRQIVVISAGYWSPIHFVECGCHRCTHYVPSEYYDLWRNPHE